MKYLKYNSSYNIYLGKYTEIYKILKIANSRNREKFLFKFDFLNYGLPKI